LTQHHLLNRNLFWLEGISDEFLQALYDASDALISASKGEGFGLPLIEAAQHRLPIIARDLPVFREVAGKYAFYFEGKTSDSLAEDLQRWMKLFHADQHPRSDAMPWLTWRQSAEQLLHALEINSPSNKTINAKAFKS
jgi:glycosyltransferase involved in cell wall biosynthesis